MSITAIVPYIQSTPVDADEPEPSSRAELIDSLPNYLEVVLSAAEGLNLINVGTEVPSMANRDKPWFSSLPSSNADYPRGLYVWNEEIVVGGEWQNIAPDTVAAIIADAQEALAKASDAEAAAKAARADADISRQYADAAKVVSAAADTTASDAEDAVANAYEEYSDVYYGHIDSLYPPPTVGAWASDHWVDLVGVPPLGVTPLPVAFITIESDSIPEAVFRYGVEIQNLATTPKARLVGYNFFTYTGVRVVKFSWMVKGKAL